MADMWSIKGVIKCSTLGYPKGMKNAVSIPVVFALTFLSEMKI